MQRIVQLLPTGKVNEYTLTFTVYLGGGWIPIEKIGNAPWQLRIVQIIQSDKLGWFALVEPLP